jgi:hypothetical protein
MADEQQVMYDGFSDTGIHYVDWVQITKEFLKFAFADGRCEASCPCSRCENRRMLSKYEMSAHLANLCRTTFCDTNTRRCGLR